MTDRPYDCETFVDVLLWRAQQQPQRLAYCFLPADGSDEISLSYGQLDQRARSIAFRLQQSNLVGERALLLYPPGLDYIAAFFACLYAGVIAVPVYPPRVNRSLRRLRSIAIDSEPRAALTIGKIWPAINDNLSGAPELAHLQWLITDEDVHAEATQWDVPTVRADGLALLQYTSGSTGSPKGVMIGHRNLMHNSRLARQCFQLSAHSRGVTWLPPYHDMGLIGGILQPLYSGFPQTVLSPASFLQRPVRWLDAISRDRATLSAAPNFAYDLCVRNITLKQRDQLDLRCWTAALCGSEPVRVETLARFAEFFAPCGFSAASFLPCYGLAEVTVFASGCKLGTPAAVAHLDAAALTQHRVQEAKSNGPSCRTLSGVGAVWVERVEIVDPETCVKCAPDRVGEIWVADPSVAQGYWNRSEDTKRTFHAYLADSGQGPFLRTGDLGFVRNGELFVTGRLKELIIVHGRNHYPQDIEASVERSHPALRSGGGAAFAIERSGSEQLVIVHEVDRRWRQLDVEDIFVAIRRAIAEEHELETHAIVLVPPMNVPKTSSGKTERRACRDSYFAGTLEVRGEWRKDVGRPACPRVAVAVGALKNSTVKAIEFWLIARIATLLDLAPADIDMRTPFSHFGLDSVKSVALSGELETWLGLHLSPTLLWDYPTIENLSRHLAGEAEEPLRGRLEACRPDTTAEAIAIVGLSCRFPGAGDLVSFWTLLADGADGTRDVPPDRWDVGAYFSSDPAARGKMVTRRGGFIDEVDGFDAAFFGVAPREAARMDPQQRLLLEVAWEAIEHTGRRAEELAGTSTGVFVGISSGDYGHVLLADPETLDAYTGTGSALSIAANRISYIFGLQGPSMAVDTACSSSLVALDLACQNLRAGRCDLALAGGVNLMLSPELTITFSQARMMSPDGRCKTFDGAADGYVRGEGCGVVVLKRLGDALRDGDRIRAVIRGSAVNHDGRSNGLTAPNGQAQEAVIRSALADAGVDPLAVSYVEAHGTGTPLGDPIELRALARAYAQERPLAEPLLVGSVKTNLGHLEAAAGIAGVIKVVLALEHSEIPAHLHLNKPTPLVNWEELRLRVARECQPWMAAPRLAGVSSFGFGGTNAHAILEAAPEVAREVPRLPARPMQVVALSGKSEEALSALAGRYAAHLGAHGDAAADAAYTANVGRSRFEHRAAVVGCGTELIEQLDALARNTVANGTARGRVAASGPPLIAFLFTGQGSQYSGMGRELYDTEPCFREVIDGCAEALVGEWDVGLREVLFAAGGDDRLIRTFYIQPALYALECGLAALWRSWGIEPGAVLGHSVGEYAAAWVAGMFGLEEGVRLVAARARLMQDLPSDGAMAAVFATEEAVLEVLGEGGAGLSIAAVNGPEEVVLSGDRGALETTLDRLKRWRIGARRLKVSQAFHSAVLDPMLDRFTAMAEEVRFAAPRIGFVSNVSGSLVEGSEICAATYWRRQLREPVRFADGMATLHREGYRTYIEIGPQPTLLAMGSRCVSAQGQAWLASLRRGVADLRQILESLAELHVRGADIDWAAFEAGRGGRLVDLPTYPFQRQKFWIDRTETAGTRRSVGDTAQQLHPLLAMPTVTEPSVSELVEQLHAALPADRLNLVVERLQAEVARVLRLPRPPDPNLGFAEMGMDSLMAVELRRRLESGLGRNLSSTVAFDYPNIARLARYLLREVVQLEPTVAPQQLRRQAGVGEPIAVIGLACRFPGGANDPDSFWQLLREGRDAVVPVSRWSIAGWYNPDIEASGTSYCREGAWLDAPVDQFDARFFGIAPREAVAMDPQQRLLLELSWEALEAAGHAPERLVGSRAGVFVGINTNDYARLLGLNNNEMLDAYVFTGNTFSVAAGRVSHILGFQGPCLAIDTACSSSLVAVHLACQSLRMQECDLALAGGVNLMLSPDGHVVLSRMRALAPDGRSKAFDASADGYGRGEGGGVLALKRLSEAVTDGDRILALLRGSAVNHDGPSSGLTVPNGPAQQALIREALSRAGVVPTDIGYLEAHGTGTALGDPIEIDAVNKVLCQSRAPDRPLIVGSVKTNIGHLEAAAGVAGLIKVVLALQHSEIPPHLHFCNPSPQISWETLAVSVPTDGVAWPAAAGRRLAGVSAFGMSGTNAHVIVEEAPAPGGTESGPGIDRPLHVVMLSGRSAEALTELAGRYRDHVPGHPDQSLGDIGFTANAGRSHFAHRVALVAATREDLIARLTEVGTGGEGAGVVRGQVGVGERPRVAFLFTGQGSQYAGMGRGLYETQPVFRAALDHCAEVLRQYLQEPLLSLLYEPGRAPELLDQTGITQPALFALEYALAELWRSWGIEPAVVLGHSVGEYVAACVAGVFRVDEGLALVARRGQLMQALPAGGAMAAALADEEQVAAALARHGSGVSIAAVNGPSHVVIAGAGAAVAGLCQVLQDQGIRTQALRVSHAFHSALMEPMLAEFAQVAAGVEYRSPRLRLISNVSGKVVEGGTTLTADYWVRHVREAVRFHDGLKTLQEQGCRLVLEIGPQPTLLALGQECPGAESAIWLASLRRGRDDWAQMLDSLARLYVQGCEVDWDGFDRPYHRRRLALPTYPFQRKRYWPDIVAFAPPPPKATEPGGDWLYELAWRPSTISDAAIEEETNLPHQWLIFADRIGTAAGLAAKLRGQGQPCITISHGAAGHDATEDHFGIDPSDPDAVERLLITVQRRGGPRLSRILHLWSLDGPVAGETDAASLEEAQVLGPRATLHIVQALLKLMPDHLPKVWLVTRGARPVDGTVSCPAQAPLWGVGQVLALENPEMWGGLIDLDPARPAGELADLLRHIRAPVGEDLVAFRGGNRYVARLVRSPSQPSQAATAIRPDASYLITGGLGSLGLKVVGWMVEQGARNVVLLGRSPASAATEDAIRAMEQAGAQIRVLRCDVVRREELARALQEIDRSLPPLRGIVHAAGVLDDGILFKQSWERFVRVMAPKVEGAWNLHDLTRSRPLDFFVMFSSAAALLGSPGQSNYAAANAFLDVLAHYRRSLGLPALTIGWGPWSQVGMAAELARRSGRQWTPQGVTALDPADGLRILGRLMQESRSHVGVLPVVWAEFLKQFPAGDRPRVLAEVAANVGPLEEASVGEASRSPVLALLAEARARERRDILVDYIQREVARVMGMDHDESPDPELGFFDMGLDSLMAIELKNHLSTAFGVSLPATTVFRYPNIGALSRYLLTDVLALAETTTTNGNGSAATDGADDLGEISEEGLLAMLADELGRIDSDRVARENAQ